MCMLSCFSHVWLCGTQWTVTCQAPLSMGILEARTLEWDAMLSSRGSSWPGIKPRSPALQADYLSSESPGKPKNFGVGSLSLLQGIFPTQESNQGLLCCRWTLYQLSYQGSPAPALSSVQSLSRVWLCDPMDCSTPGFPVHHQLPEPDPHPKAN